MAPDWQWLESTKTLQRESYGLEATPDPAITSTTVKENVLPLIVEAVELLDNVSWKYWAHDRPFVDRERVLKEAVDIGHFLANILVSIGVADDEFWAAYRRKQEANAARQRNGYRVLEKDGADD